ncbi:MAG: Nramp family divalent metal transporter [Anaerolineae bacterium]
MSTISAEQGLEPVATATPTPLAPRQARALQKPGVTVNIWGREVMLRGLRRAPTGIWRWLLILGPGIIAGAAGNDAGGIATYSQTGAQYGYELLWVLLLMTVSLSVVQEMSARLGAATGRGLLDLVRERFGLRLALLAAGVVLIANGGLIISEFVGIGAATELFGIPRYISIPIAVVLLWALVVIGSYNRVEKILLLMTLAFIAYPIAAFLSHPNPAEVAHGLFVPSFKWDGGYVLILVALMGTTLTPYQQIFQQSATVEKGVARRHYGPEKVDTYVGMAFSNLMSAFIIIATAATLHVNGQTNINSAAEAAQALAPAAGQAASLLFGVGLLGAALMAGGVLPIATAYSIGEVFGFRKGVNLSFRRARTFFLMFTALLVLGAAAALIPGLPVMQLLVGVQVLNGILLPVILVFLMLLINDDRLVGDLKNGRIYNILGWATIVIVAGSVAVLLGSQLLSLFGVSLFPGG